MHKEVFVKRALFENFSAPVAIESFFLGGLFSGLITFFRMRSAFRRAEKQLSDTLSRVRSGEEIDDPRLLSKIKRMKMSSATDLKEIAEGLLTAKGVLDFFPKIALNYVAPFTGGSILTSYLVAKYGKWKLKKDVKEYSKKVDRLMDDIWSAIQIYETSFKKKSSYTGNHLKVADSVFDFVSDTMRMMDKVVKGLSSAASKSFLGVENPEVFLTIPAILLFGLSFVNGYQYADALITRTFPILKEIRRKNVSRIVDLVVRDAVDRQPDVLHLKKLPSVRNKGGLNILRKVIKEDTKPSETLEDIFKSTQT